MGASCSHCVQGDDVRSLSRQQSGMFDTSKKSSRSIFSTPSAQDDFLKKQRDDRKRQRTTAAKQQKVAAKQIGDTAPVAASSPLFEKKTLPKSFDGERSNTVHSVADSNESAPRSVLSAQEQESVGHGSASWNEHTCAPVKDSHTVGSHAVSNALTSDDHSSAQILPQQHAKAAPAKKGRKQILFFMPDS